MNESRLYERDWRYMFDAVYRINSTESVEELERVVLECACLLIPCTQGTFFVAMAADGGTFHYGRPAVCGTEARFMEDFMNGEYEPYFGGAGFITRIETFRDSDILPEDYRENSKLYREIYAKQGIYWPIRSYLVHGGKPVGNISLFNAKERGDFTMKDVSVLDALAPHISLKLSNLLDEELLGSAKQPAMAIPSKYGLTSREHEIILSLFSEASDEEIADKLCIAMSTFRKHVYNAYRKLNVNNRTQLYALLRDVSKN